MYKKLFFVLLSLFIGSLIQEETCSAPIWNFPVIVIQPNGDTLHCFVSGDEYNNWYHDAEGYTIIQSPSTGYYVYAEKVNNRIVATNYIAGKVNPASIGLVKGVNRTLEEMTIRRDQSLAKISSLNNVEAPNLGDINNIVIFIRFSDESEYTDLVSFYDGMFNNSNAGANSMYNYYNEVSYNQLSITSTFYPTPTGSTVLSYQDINPRSYYMPYNEITNPNGYSDSERMTREQQLLQRAINSISSQVSTGLDIDNDDDGYVDNVCFIVSGSPTAWSTLLWPHMSVLYNYPTYINGIRVYTYNFQIQTHLAAAANGVLCHEMFHSIGAPDLYHYTPDGMNPVHLWDLMEYNTNPPQHMGAYMKYKYGKWIGSIPEIVSAGAYSLNPLVSSTNNCYKIESPYSTREFFIMEYRRKEGAFENSIPGSGILIYRINMDERGNASGPPDEVYIYRPDGTTTTNGTPQSANFSSNVGRTTFNDATNPNSFLTNGSAGGLSVQNIGASNATISFTVNSSTFPPQFTHQTSIDLPDVQSGSVSWGDYNNDGLLDLFITGNTVRTGSAPISQLYVNDGNGNFYNSNLDFIGVYISSAKWGDYNNDGNLDIIISGYTGSSYITQLYKNTGSNTFTPVANIIGLGYSSLDWGDYDNDGDLDLVICGLAGSTRYTRVYRNNGDDTFSYQSTFGLKNVYAGEVIWGDINGDGNLDIFLTGQQTSSSFVSTIYYNNGNNSFTEQTPAGILSESQSIAALGDYDNDGDLDIFLAGFGSSYFSKLYRNDGGNSFYEMPYEFTWLQNGDASWGDYDNDGDLDLINVGLAQTRIHKNLGDDNFAQINSPTGTYPWRGSVAWGDYDNDGDLDYAINGYDIDNIIETRIYKNEEYTQNSVPTAPINLTSSYDATGITFSWSKYNYDGTETPMNGLTYNLVVSTTPGGIDILSPMAIRGGVNDGNRRVIGQGNTGHQNTWKITGLGPGVYYWSVQAIDNSFAGSPFATEQIINYPLPVELSLFTADLLFDKVKLSWKTETEVNNYGFEIERSTSANDWNKIGFIEGYGNSNSPKSYSFVDNNLIGGSKFKYRLKQIDNDGQFEYSKVVEVEVLPTTFALYQNYPNPFNPVTTIRYQLPKESKVVIKIYDMLGSEVMELLNEQKELGIYEVDFNASNLSSGIYLYKLQAGDFVESKKMILLK